MTVLKIEGEAASGASPVPDCEPNPLFGSRKGTAEADLAGKDACLLVSVDDAESRIDIRPRSDEAHVVAEEIATRLRGLENVEGAVGQAQLDAPVRGLAAIELAFVADDRPVVERFTTVISVKAVVVISRNQLAARSDSDGWYDGLLAQDVLVGWRLADAYRIGPGKTAVARHREGDLIDAGETDILPHKIEISVVWIDGHVEQDGGIAHRFLSVGRYAAEDGGDRRRITYGAEGRTLVEGANEADPRAVVGRDLGKEIEHGSARRRHHDIVDRLRVAAGVENLPRLLPGCTAVGGARKEGGTFEEHLGWLFSSLAQLGQLL